MNIRKMNPDDFDAVKQFTVRAFEPVFESFEKIMRAEIFPIVYPDWRALHAGFVETFYNDEHIHVRVADINGEPVGFLAYQFNKGGDHIGEIVFLAVHPDYQNDGVGTQLNNYALSKFRAAGMKVAVVSTGGDPSHAPARHAYEKVGFKPLPNVWYFQHLDES